MKKLLYRPPKKSHTLILKHFPKFQKPKNFPKIQKYKNSENQKLKNQNTKNSKLKELKKFKKLKKTKKNDFFFKFSKN